MISERERKPPLTFKEGDGTRLDGPETAVEHLGAEACRSERDFAGRQWVVGMVDIGVEASRGERRRGVIECRSRGH